MVAYKYWHVKKTIVQVIVHQITLHCIHLENLSEEFLLTAGLCAEMGDVKMLMEIGTAIIRASASFLLLMIMTRILGRKALSQMTFFDFAVVITFGSVAANIGIGHANTFVSSVTVLITVGLLGLLSGVGHIKSFRFRKMINSEPIIVIADGQIVEENMRKGRLTINELNSMLRNKDVFDIADVHYAILENSGTLSVLLKAEKKPLTSSDMLLKPPEEGLTKDIIIDGIIMKENLNATHMTEAWLINELKMNNIYKIEDVFYAGLSTNGSLYISKKVDRGEEKHGQHGID